MDEAKLTQLLQAHFGFKHFRSGQFETLQAVLAGQDTLAILPTGGGKSLLYQLPAYLLPGTILIISPLISLMQDQADRITRQGDFRAVVLNSAVNNQDQTAILATLSRYRFIFTSPETLGRGPVLGALRQLTISLFVIDEAHCVSEWGPDFRPEYLLLKAAIQALQPRSTLLLTATATKRVTQDILTKVGLPKEQVTIIRQSVNRANLFLAVQELENSLAKQTYLQATLPKLGGPGVIYFSSRKQADAMARWLTTVSDLRVAAYHAGLEAVERFRIQNQFMQNELDVICATSAFGMGIDKNDLRYVIHYHLPASLAAYTQEIGRAGRDGQPALALLLYAPGDETIPELLTQVELPSQTQMERVLTGKISPTMLGEKGPVINFYLHHGYQPQDLPALFNQQAKRARQRINQMLAYIKNQTCRRKVLLAAFDEGEHEQTPCCDLHQPDLQQSDFGLGKTEPAKVKQRQLDWQKQLNRLFNCQN